MSPITLTDQQLLAELVGKREAKRLYKGALAPLLLESRDDPGRGKLKIAGEFIRRVLREEMVERPVLTRSSVVRDFVRLYFAGREYESFVAILLDGHNRFIAYEELSRGTLARAPVYPREVVKCALRYNASAVIFAHNHPSGVSEPSFNDVAITNRLKDALELVDVIVLDHIVAAGNDCTSFVERGLLES